MSAFDARGFLLAAVAASVLAMGCSQGPSGSYGYDSQGGCDDGGSGCASDDAGNPKLTLVVW